MLAVEQGDLTSPTPRIVRECMPKLATAVDSLFAEVRASIENAHALGMYDPVTSLPNRLHFRAEADKLLAARQPETKAAMLFVDLDRFKNVNDSLGHARGDQLLIMVANRLRVVVTAELGEGPVQRPLLARLAGDEFTIFFPEIEEAADAERVARRIALAISEPFELHGHSIDIGASVGVAISPDHGVAIEGLMRAADIAMYRAKNSGGGRYCLFSEELAEEHQRKIDTEAALSEAVQRGEFLLALQPQLSFATGEVSGAEALLRWNHPREGMRMPGDLHSDRRADRDHRRHRRLGDRRSRLDAGRMACPGRQAATGVQRQPAPARPRRLLPAAARRPSPRPGCRCRWSSWNSPNRRRWNVRKRCWPRLPRLRRDGASIAIDDFGTGYSNIARLRAMPLDRVKLDPSLIADIETSEQARVVVQAVIQLIKGVGAEIVAEAVENVGAGRHPPRHGLRNGPGLRLRPSDVRGRISGLDAATPTAARAASPKRTLFPARGGRSG